MRGDKECPFGDVTRSGRVWRKVPESDARSVLLIITFIALFSALALEQTHCALVAYDSK